MRDDIHNFLIQSLFYLLCFNNTPVCLIHIIEHCCTTCIMFAMKVYTTNECVLCATV